MAFERGAGVIDSKKKKTPAPARNTFLPGNPTAGEFGRRVIKQKERETTQQTQPKKTPAPMTNTNPRSLPGNPNEGEQNRKMKENYEKQVKQNRWANNDPYYPKAKTAKITSNSKIKVGGKDNTPTAKRLAEAFGSAAKTSRGVLSGSAKPNSAHSNKAKSVSSKAINGVNIRGGGNKSFTISAPRASKKSKK